MPDVRSLGALAAVLFTPVAAAHAPLVTPTHVGPLKIGRSQPADVLKAFGNPEQSTGDRHVLVTNYDCRRSTVCRTGFVFALHGRNAGRLVEAILSAPERHFRTANGTRLGMTSAKARARETSAVPSVICGLHVLRSKPAPRGDRLSGLTIVLGRGKVTSFLVTAGSERARCTGKGKFEVTDHG